MPKDGAQMTPRSLPKALAPVVEQLELDQPRVVTLPMLTEILLRTRRETAARPWAAAYELQRRGWLGRLRTKGAWEFLPGARAGAYGSGDRFIELRAQLALKPDWAVALAMESAAGASSLAQHLPEREVLAMPPGERLPKALSGWRAVTVTMPPAGTRLVDDLPSWNLEGILAGIATRPSGYADLAGLGQWLPEAGARIRVDVLASCLVGRPVAAWQRAAYLTRSAGALEAGARLLAAQPPRTMAWFGATRTGGRYDRASMVNDADLAPYLSGGTGA